MTTLILNKKKYVVVEQRKYEKLLEIAARKKPLAKKFSLSQGKKFAYSLVDKWDKER